MNLPLQQQSKSGSVGLACSRPEFVLIRMQLQLTTVSVDISKNDINQIDPSDWAFDFRFCFSLYQICAGSIHHPRDVTGY
jgi:hypothetical protein